MSLVQENKYFQSIEEAACKGDIEKIKQDIKEFNELNPHIENASRKFGESVFVSAVDNKHYDIATYIVEIGLYEADSALHDYILAEIESYDYAKRKPEDDEDPYELFSFLISVGANVNYYVNCGGSPLDLAVKWHYDKAAEFLRKAGAKHSKVFKETGEA